jgi:hypothetical protein
MKNVLTGYGRPPRRDALTVELLERDALPLVGYVAPVLPRFAMSARQTGDVRRALAIHLPHVDRGRDPRHGWKGHRASNIRTMRISV